MTSDVLSDWSQKQELCGLLSWGAAVRCPCEEGQELRVQAVRLSQETLPTWTAVMRGGPERPSMIWVSRMISMFLWFESFGMYFESSFMRFVIH